MYLDHFGLREAPFRITPHTDFFFSGANRGATLGALSYAVVHDEGIVKITGEVGSGKTMLCRMLIEKLPDNVVSVYVGNPSLSRDEILHTLAAELGLDDDARPSRLLRKLQEKLIALYGEGRRVVALIDEAHAMPTDTLEAVRLLSNLESSRHKLLQIVLFGQPELNQLLARQDMRPLRERITHNFLLEPLVRHDIADYLDFRMRAAGYKGPCVFSNAAIKRISEASLGLTRRVNILADKALLAAFATNQHGVDLKEVDAAIRDMDYPAVPSRKGVALVAAGTVAIAGLAALALLRPTTVASPSSAATPAIAAPPLQASATEPPQAQMPPVSAIAAAPAAPLPQLKTTETPAAPAPAPAAGGSIPATMADAPLPAVLDKTGPRTRNALRRFEKWIAKASGRSYFIQLLRADLREAPQVEAFLDQLSTLLPEQEVRTYYVNVKGQRWLGVIFGEYPDWSSASRAAGEFPPALKARQPYPRQVSHLR